VIGFKVYDYVSLRTDPSKVVSSAKLYMSRRNKVCSVIVCVNVMQTFNLVF